MARIAFLDFEASGLQSDSYPIEVGFALSTGEPAQALLIRPAAHWTGWDPQAQALHGISRSMLFAHGHAVDDVAIWLRRHLNGLDLYVGADEDLGWFNRLLDAAHSDWRPRIYNARALIESKALKHRHDLRALSAAVARRHAAANLGAHRAGPDAAYLRALYRAACRRA